MVGQICGKPEVFSAYNTYHSDQNEGLKHFFRGTEFRLALGKCLLITESNQNLINKSLNVAHDDKGVTALHKSTYPSHF